VVSYLFVQVDLEEDKLIMYDLLGVVQHSGSLHGGHYTAYVKYTQNSSSQHSGDQNGDQEGTESGLSIADHQSDSASRRSGYSAAKPLLSRFQHSYHSENPNVVESGTLLPTSGDHWFYTSDSYNEPTTKDDVHNSQAYLLLYVKRHR